MRDSSSSYLLRAAVWLRVRRWSDWLLLALAHVTHGVLLRVLATPALLDKWANARQRALWVPALGLVLGAAEDLIVCALALAFYRLIDTGCGPAKRAKAAAAAAAASGASPLPSVLPRSSSSSTSSAGADALRFVGYALVFALSSALSVADAVLVRTRQLRASTEFLHIYVRERDAADLLQVDAHELRVLHEHLALMAAFALLVGYFGAVWSDLTEWHVLRALQRFRVRRLGWRPARPQQQTYLQVPQREDKDSGHRDEDDAAGTHRSSDAGAKQRCVDRLSTRTLLVVLLAAFGAATVALSQLVPSIVAMVALNASLNESLRLLAGLELYAMHRDAVPAGRRMADFVEHETEDAEMFSQDALFRRTRGFKGPLAFNVSIRPGEQLNVLVVVVESFRQKDSRYLLQEAAFAKLFAAGMPSLTPQFDRWARRGVAFRNMWSSWRTSRALESLLFGQVPYDSVTATGTTRRPQHVALSGLPQLFRAKGYECIFTTGSHTNYDDWDAFLPAHGFDHVLDMSELADIATDEIGIDVTEGEQVMAYWGLHDHVSFDVLGFLLQKRHLEQQNASIHNAYHAKHRAKAERRSSKLDTTKPWFVTHFTISSHVPFDERPDWYHRYSHEIPDFAAFYRRAGVAAEHEELLRNYAEMRFYADLTLGLFLDNLNATGVLNNTLVFVTGDHGQAPERGSATPEQDQMAATRVAGALIAEGRLGDSAGLLFDDVASHADLLNTLADIVGVPRDGGGFLQSGVGHSLKRAVPFGQRVVHSNNPAVSMAAVQGHTRMQYYTAFSDAVQAFDTEADAAQTHDLMAELPPARVQQIRELCAEGRMVSDYFRRRWDRACILAPTC